jgi:hypothetical protein
MTCRTVGILTVCLLGSSSLARLESTTKVVDANIAEIKDYMRVSMDQQKDKFSKPPAISMATDEDMTCLFLINAGFMKHAEALGPWTAIGIDRWIQAGHWWLLKAQMGLDKASSGDSMSLGVYVCLLKASWILIDVTTNHPQLSFLDSSTHFELKSLSVVRLSILGPWDDF